MAATETQQQSKTHPNTVRAYRAFFAGWLVPGGGHFVEKRWGRGGLLFAAIVMMYACGLAMGGKVYNPNAGDVLDILGFFGDLGSLGLYGLARIMDWGQAPAQVVMADYGTKFVVVAGLLNFIAAVDAYDIALGKKS
jgi:hypothetical protein